MHRFLEYALLLFVVVVLQVFLFDNLRTGFYLNPFVYPAFVILLPVKVRGYLLLLLAALVGVVMDVFMGTPAINTMATVFMAFCRPGVLRLFLGRDELDEGGVPNIRKMGVRRFLYYSAILVLIHSAAFFMLETFGASGLGYTLAKTAVSVVSSVVVIYLCQLLFIVNRSKI